MKATFCRFSAKSSNVASGGFPERLHKISHPKEYLPTKKTKLPILHHRLFKLQALHKFEQTESFLQKNRRGFTTSSAITAALAPSLTHFLFNRGGICFEESAALLKDRRIEVDGKVVESQEQMESQEFWFDIATRDIRIRLEEEGEEGGRRQSVPVAHRAIHRKYFITYINPARHNVTTEMTDPKSLIHKMARYSSPTDRLGMNIVRPMGYISGMGGLAILTNDVLTLRHWNNESCGNFGVYELRFHRGAPPEELKSVEELVSRALRPIIRQQHRDLRNQGYGCWQQEDGLTSSDPLVPHVPPQLLRQLQATRLMVKTPLFPYRVFKAVRPRVRLCSLVQMGPFVLPPSLGREECRPLAPEELTAFFAFERKLKTNRLVFTLREFDDDKVADESDGAEEPFGQGAEE